MLKTNSVISLLILLLLSVYCNSQSNKGYYYEDQFINVYDDSTCVVIIFKEAYLKENKHLPLIATQKDIEANGLQIGSTMKGFVYNIENLELENKQLKTELEKLK